MLSNFFLGLFFAWLIGFVLQIVCQQKYVEKIEYTNGSEEYGEGEREGLGGCGNAEKCCSHGENKCGSRSAAAESVACGVIACHGGGAYGQVVIYEAHHGGIGRLFEIIDDKPQTVEKNYYERAEHGFYTALFQICH